MKLEQLHLIAFGPFADRTLDFSPPGLHVVYGPNEAGKSTALRAISGLLFGIPRTTRDAHRHGYGSLRVGARLVSQSGDVLDVIRRKRDKNSLLDPNGNPIAEEPLRHMLGGIGERLFETMFGLDQHSLREGGQALLEGGGDVGESLFDAGLGGRGVHSVLQELRKEAENLFRPRASKPTINAALADLKQAQKDRRHDDGLSPEVWAQQKANYEDQCARREQLRRRKQALEDERVQRRRLHRTLPRISERARLRSERATLDRVPALPADAPERRQQARRRRHEAAERLQKIQDELAHKTERRDALQIPESLAALDQDLVDELQQWLGSHRKSAREQPQLEGQLRQLEAEARAALDRLGWKVSIEQATEHRVTSATQAKVRRLAQEYSRLAERRASEDNRRAQAQRWLEALDEQLAEYETAPDREPLRAATAAAQRRAELDRRLGELRRERDALQSKAEERVAALGWSERGLEALVRAPVPGLETVERFERELGEIRDHLQRLEEKRQELEQSRSKTERDLDALRRSGEVPTEMEVVEARQHRDRGWALVKRAWLQEEDVTADETQYDADRPLSQAYEAAVDEADQLADRLRREAEQVAQRVRLEADQAAAERELEELDEQKHRAEGKRSEVQGRWEQLWAAAGLEPTSPAEMRGWLQRRDEAAQIADRLREVSREHDALHCEREELRTRLSTALRGLGENGLEPDTPLSDALDHAAHRLSELEHRSQQRAALQRDRQQRQSELQELDHQLNAVDQELARRHAEWSEAVRELGLSTEVTADEVEAVLSDMNQLFGKLDELHGTRNQLDRIERDAEQLRSHVHGLLELHAPDLSELSLEEATSQFRRRYNDAQRDLQLRNQLTQEIAEREDRLQDTRREIAQADEELAELMRAASVGDLESLEAAEQRMLRARELEQQIEAKEQELLSAGEGLGLEQLLQEAEGVDPTENLRRIDELDREIEDLDEAIRDTDQKIGGVQTWMEQKGHVEDHRAADNATEVELHSARVRESVDRYIRVKLAAVLLEREIERYREQNQGPVVERARQLFPRLTLDAYRDLRVEIGDRDQPVLHCIRADGTAVEVEGLSDGTRDQLFLALRVASLERYGQHGEPLPLVLDDALIHFDDDRARAALAVLGELTGHLQVLFFTHHARLLELAREALPEHVLACHELRRTTAVPESGELTSSLRPG
jgi:uncharacterized protein YhaN